MPTRSDVIPVEPDFDTVHERRSHGSAKWANRWDEYSPQLAPNGVLPFWTADMDFRAPQPVIDRLVDTAQHGIYGYTLREASHFQSVSDWFAARHDWAPEPGTLLFAPGIMPAVSLILQTFTAPGDGVIVQSPVYFPYFEAVRGNGRKLLLNPLELVDGRYQLNLDDFERQAAAGARVFILCNPHNPSGRAWTRPELESLAEICARHGVIVISDEIHCDIRLTSVPHCSFATIDSPAARGAFVCTAPTKTFNLAGLQCATISIGALDRRERFYAASAAAFLTKSNMFARVGLEAAYREGGPWLDSLTLYLKGNLALVDEFARERLPRMVPVAPDASFLIWLDATKIDAVVGDVHEFLVREARVNLYDGRRFGPGGEGFLRLNIACPKSVLLEGLERMAEAIARLELPR